jgi:hypothetical protein
MGKLVIAVVHPTLNVDGGTLDPLTELRGWRAEVQISGASTWTPVGGLNPPNVVEREMGNAVPGATYLARVQWEDIYGQVSDYATDNTDVPVPGRPMPGGVSVTFVP